ncbi:MAG: Coenzyme F420 hydrogenase/dehydrogenase, beta subunit C-terminal domain [Gammaproteobacteria bacterium]|nr:Coenzyme F420 hydrogenase/dehydrogenase, beta subunit C-terminal domain [Gammaproteobacteria bacterium]
MDLDKLTVNVQKRYRSLVESEADPNEWAYAWRSEYNRGGFKAVDFLMREVVTPGKCVGCAACVTICPVDVFDYEDEKPRSVREDACVFCELCADVCPVLRPTDRDLPTQIGLLEPNVDEGFGPYQYAMLARATPKAAIGGRGQDGGVASTLVIHMMDQGEIQGAVLGAEEQDNPQMGGAKLAQTPEEVLTCARSRYTYQPNTLALAQAMKEGVAPLAVVGVPCQVDGVRQQQFSSIRLDVAEWYRENVKLVIGLFCSESFTEAGIDNLSQRFEVPKKDIENINIKGRIEVKIRGGREEIVSLKDFREFARPACLYCLDYSADNSDIGLGGIGLHGWTFTVVRTEAGHRVFQSALAAGLLETQPLDAAPKSKDLLIKLAKYKRNRPLPALMPTLQQRQAEGNLDPKDYYKGYKKAPKAEQATTEVQS